MKLTFDQIEPEAGEIDLSPIILLHAMMDSRKSWKVVAPQIADKTGRVVYCVDARNHGTSPWSEDFTLQLMADDIKDFLSEHGISKAILVGSSMGGSVAMKLALGAPALVEKLIVENMVPEPYPKDGWKMVLDAVVTLKKALEEIPKGSNLLAAKKAITSYVSTNIPHMHPNKNHEFGTEVMPLKEDKGTFKWEANLDVIEVAIANKDFDTGLTGTYSGEALFLYGTESDMKVGKDAKIPALFPQAKTVPVKGSARMTHFEMPDEFVKHVVKFIQA